MAILRSLRTRARTRFLDPLASFLSHRTTSFCSNPTTPFCERWDVFTSRCGPPFLSPTTPWKLSRLSTPHFSLPPQYDAVSVRSGAFLGVPRVSALRLLKTGDLSARLGFRLLTSSSVDLPEKKKKSSGGGGSGGDRRGLVESFVNWPNAISMSRLISGPFIGWMIMHEMYLPAFVGLAISGATDWLDGYVARKMGINSVVGSYLDPLADKVLIGCVALAMVEKGLLHSGLVGIIVLRDITLVGGAVYKRASDLDWEWRSWLDFFNLDGARPQKVEPLLISKLCFNLSLVLWRPNHTSHT